MKRSMSCAALLALPFLVGTAVAQEADHEWVTHQWAAEVRSISEVDVAPELIDCAHVDPVSSRYRVRVEFVVAADGTVVPGTPRGRSFDVHRMRHAGVVRPLHTPREVVREAEEIAATCRFAPATRDGETVAVRFSKWFGFQFDTAGRTR